MAYPLPQHDNRPLLVATAALFLAFCWRPAPMLGQDSAGAPGSAEPSSLVDERDRLVRQSKELAAAGDYAASIDLAQQALAVELELVGEIHEDVALLYGWIGKLHWAADDYEAAAASYDQRAEVLSKLPDAKRWEVVDAQRIAADARLTAGLDAAGLAKLAELAALNDELQTKYQAGDHEAVSAIAQQVLALQREVYGDEHPEVAVSLAYLAGATVSRGEYATAMPLYERAISITVQARGEDHPETASLVRNLAGLCRLMGDADRALALYRRALDIRKATVGEQHPETAAARNALAGMHELMGEHDQAAAVREQAGAPAQAASGDATRESAERDQRNAERSRLLHRARELAEAGETAEAADVAEQMLAVHQQLAGPHDELTPSMLEWIGRMRLETRQFDAAISAFERRATFLAQRPGVPAWRISDAQRDLADAKRRALLPAKELALLDEALDLRRQLDELYEAETTDEAMVPATRLLEIYRTVLGEHPRTAAALNNLAGLHVSAGEYQQAQTLYEQALAIRRDALGDNHPATAETLDGLSVVFRTRAQFKQAIPYCEQALAIRRQTLGNQDATTAQSVNDLGFLHSELGDYDRALELFEEALNIRWAVLGDEHPATADSLSDIANLYRIRGEYDSALKLYQAALTIRQSALGGAHPDTAAGMHNVALVHRELGHYSQALEIQRDALQITREAHGEQHGDTAAVMNALGELQELLGNLAAAQPLYERALAIRSHVHGEKHPAIADTLINLASVWEEQGGYARAIPLLERAAAIREELFGPNHLQVAAALNRLANLLAVIGDYARAATLAERALNIREQALGLDSHPAADSLATIAYLYQQTGNHDQALALMNRVLAIREKTVGPDHPDALMAMHNIASSLHLQGKQEEAREILEQVLAVRTKSLPVDHPDVALSLNNLAGVSLDLGDLEQARELFQRALAIRRRGLGKAHPRTAISMSNLAYVLAANGERSPAIELYLESFAIQRNVLERQIFELSRTQLQGILSLGLPPIDALAQLIPEAGPQREAVVETILATKAIAFEARRRQVAADRLAAANEDLAAVRTELRERRKQLEDLATSPPEGTDVDQLAARLQEIRRRIGELETQLNRALASALGISELSLEVSLAELRDRLPVKSALIEFIRTEPLDFDEPQVDGHRGPPRFLALVIAKTSGSDVQIIDLGPAAEIEDLIDNVSRQSRDFARLAALGDEEFLEEEYAAVAEELYEKLFAPLLPALGDAKQIYVGPDVRLHELAFEALVDRDGRYLIERDYQFAYVNSARDVLQTGSAATGDGVYVFAGPNYNLAAESHATLAASLSNDAAATTAAANSAANSIEERSGLAARGTPGTLSRAVDTRRGWRHLPGADLEGEEAAAAFAGGEFGPVQVYTGDAALEERVKRVRQPRVLVLVTHGDFLGDEPDGGAGAYATRSLLESENRGGAGLARMGLRAAEDPMLRSYLVLAGANKLDDLPENAGLDNGWLTAQEIAQLDLEGADMIVLSACNTNRGQSSNSQAVMGMRAAFLFAGARTIVGSLFEVPNAETRQLLRPFYEGVAAGQGKLASLNAAKLAFIRDRRAAYGAAHPFYWASFILVGEP